MNRRTTTLGTQAAGAPKHMARLRFHENLTRFRHGLKIAAQCGPVKRVCRTRKDPYGRNTWTTCTWETNDKVVAASANQGHSRDLDRANLWTDRDLLKGRCPR